MKISNVIGYNKTHSHWSDFGGKTRLLSIVIATPKSQNHKMTFSTYYVRLQLEYIVHNPLGS